jgi:nitrogen fixation protein NifU and related proteins
VTSDLRDLYQEVILDHNRRPRHFQVLEDASHHADGYNPLCGDRLTVYLQVDDGVVRGASFQGSGCAISKASASLMTDAVAGKTVSEVQALFDRFHRMVTAEVHEPVDPGPLGKLAVFAGVREFPARIKCASLAWHTLQAALRARTDTVSTEEGHPTSMAAERDGHR